MTDEHRHNLGKSISRSRKGWVFSEETKRKISLANKGKLRSTETRQKFSLRMKKDWKLGIAPGFKKGHTSGMTGKKHSDETRKKMSITRIAHPSLKFNDTSIEVKIKELLESLGVSYIRQFPIGNVMRVDFYIPEKNLIIECDGCYWHGCLEHYPERLKEKDRVNTEKLKEMGYNVIRLRECEIKKMNSLPL